VFSLCCNVVIGCQRCINRWEMTKGNCPRCREPQPGYLTVNGMDKLLAETRSSDEDEDDDDEDDDDEDEQEMLADLPMFNRMPSDSD